MAKACGRGILLVALGWLAALASNARAEEKLLKVGDRVDLAQYEVVDADGKPLKLAEFKGKVLFLNFFQYG